MSGDVDLHHHLAHQLDRLRRARVICVGDVMLDRFVYGSVDRISPEAPIPVLKIERELVVLGGAGNVVRNLVSLGAECCFLSVVGDDSAGRQLTSLIGREQRVEPHLLVEKNRTTTIKTRLIAGNQQMLRADREMVAPIRAEIATDLLQRATEALAEQDDAGKILVLSDYGKGVLQADLVRKLIVAARTHKVPVIVDPKGQDYRHYGGATLLTPNRRELQEAVQEATDSDGEVEGAARKLIAVCDVGGVLVTRSQQGMTLVPGRGPARHFPAVAREVFDVSGAGDTVIATVAAALGGGLDLADACALANVAAGVVVGKVGTAACTPAEISAALRARELGAGEGKLMERAALIERVADWRAQGLRIGFTNGCFDLLHPGHISLLAQARAACDRLVVGLNSDDSVKRLKGDARPIQAEIARAIVLASLVHVDAVVIFDDDTPLTLIETLRPDVLVKGADYTVETVVGSDIVLSYGGRVLLADLTPGQSTTSTVQRIQAG